MASSPQQKARMKAVCVTGCLHEGKFYAKGDVITVREGMSLPVHFAWPGARSSTAEGAPLPKATGECALILGDAPGMLDDVMRHDAWLKRFGKNIGACSVIAVNKAPFRWQRKVNFWVSLHGSLFADSMWVDLWMRCPWQGETPPHLITGRGYRGVRHVYSTVHCDMPGGSAYLALKAAHEMGFKEIFVAGVDALSTGYDHFAPPLRHIAATMRRSGVTVRAASGALMEE